MLKIAFIVFSLRGGGAERVVSELSNQLIDEMDVAVLQLSEIEPFYKLDSRIKHVSYYGPQHGILRYAKLARFLVRELRMLAPDVIVSFGETINPFVIGVAKLVRIPVIVSNRASPLSSLKGRRGWLNPIAYRFASGVLVQTDRAVEMLATRYRRCRWIVMGNPVRLPELVPPQSSRENLCISVGFLGGQKNQAAIIRSFALAAPPDWQLIFVGDGPDRQRLEDLSINLGVGERVQFMGALPDVHAVLLRARVFVFASRSEGVPNALAEAMASGCACIAYDCITGPRELIDDGVSGLLIPLDDERRLVEGLQQLIIDEQLRDKLAKGARCKAKMFRLEQVRDEFLNGIQAVVQAR